MRKEVIYATGFYCTLLGVLGILALIVFGILVWTFRLSHHFFWILLGVGFGVVAVLAGFCLACNCRDLRKNCGEIKT